MRLNRTQNAIRNIIWGLIYKIVILIFPFIIRTVIIKNLGIDYLGLNGLFTSILNMLNLTELGVGTAIVYSMYKPISENDTDAICALMQLYKKLYRIIGLIVLAIGLGLLPFLDRLIQGTTPPEINLYTLYLIYLGKTVATYFLFAYRACLLNAYQRTDVISKIMLFLNCGMYILQILSLYVLKNFYIYAIIQPLCIGAINIFSAIAAKKIFPKLECKGEVNKEVKLSIKKRVTGLMMSKVAAMSRNAFDSVIVSAFLGLAIVGKYDNYYYVVSSVSALLVIVMTSISAGLGNSIAMESVEKNENDLYCINNVYLFIAMLCFSCFIACYQPFMSLWVGVDNLFPDYIMFSFAAYFLAEKTLNVIGQYYDAAGLWWHGKWKGFVEAIANLVLNIILCKVFGVNGIILATVGTILFIGFPLTAFYTYKYYFKKKSVEFILTEYFQVIVYLMIGGGVYWVLKFVNFNNSVNSLILCMIVRTIVAIVISTLLTVTVFGRTKGFKNSLKWIKNHVSISKR